MYNNKQIINILKFFKKNKKYTFFIIFVIISTFIVMKILVKKNNQLSQALSFNQKHIYINKSDKINITIYNAQEKFKFKANNTQHFLSQKIVTFTQPKITIFNIKNIPIWKIAANRAILNYVKKTLYLHGYVYINNLSKNKYFLSIITNQATINLITKEIFSNRIVILHGHHFYSVGKKMNGNLYTKKIKLFNNTQTYYEAKYMSYISKNNNIH